MDNHYKTIGSDELSWLFLDLNSYFASVEQQDNPALRGKPIAVLPVMTDATCAIAASKEAKAYGIKTGTPIYEAKCMCPKLVCVLARHDKYVTYHHRVLDEVIKHVPINKIWSIDELSSRLPPRQRNRTEAIAVAQRIKDGLRKNVGEHITCSIGIAPSGFLGKVASDMKKPDGLTVLEANDLPGPLFNLKLRDLPGIGYNMEERLKRAGILTLKDLWETSPKQARAIWGSVEGERFWYNLHGIHIPERMEEQSTSIGHSRMLDPELRKPIAARLVARRLTVKAATRLRRKELFASSFQFSVRTPDDQHWGGEVRILPAQDNFTFLDALDELWAIMMNELRPNLLKKVSLVMTSLKPASELSYDLFHKPDQRNETLSRVMDGINEKYGAESIMLGVSPRTSAGHVGTKIAFSRIPDVAEFHE